jgi:succinoglycan biosynthesis protein ExoM
MAAARRAGAALVAMLDDDEWPTTDWLIHLLEMREASGAGVVGGPVRPVFGPDWHSPKKIEGLWSVQRGRLNSRPYVYCTCNCLIDLAAGIEMAWAEEAVVFEEIPANRATFAWMRRRWYRQGNVGVRCELAAPGHGDLSPLVKTVLLCVRFPVYPFVSRNTARGALLWVLEAERIRGRIAAHLGILHEEYGRPARD